MKCTTSHSAGFAGVLGSWARFDPLKLGVLLSVFSVGFAYFALTFLGLKGLVMALGFLPAVIFLGWISLKDLSITLLIWMFSMSGFRLIGMVQMPGLPDFSFDRLLLVWIVIMFLLQIALRRTSLKGPYIADCLLIGHTVYLLIQMQFTGYEHFHNWVLSSVSPLFAFLYGKHIIKKEEQLRTVLIYLILLTVYYYIQSIAEQFHWNNLIWPKTIIDPTLGFAPEGRSRGPVLHPPLFGQLLGMLLMIYLFLLVRREEKWLRVFLWISLSGAFVGLLFTYTRGGWLATAVGIVLLGMLRNSYRKVLGVLAIIAIAGGLLGVIRLANTPFLKERMQNTNTLENRMAFQANALRMIADHPIWGVGYFKFNVYRPLYNQTTYVPFYGMVRKQKGATIPIHDIYVGRMAEEGVVGLGLMLAFYMAVFQRWRARWRLNPTGVWFNRDLLALFLAMMVSYLLGGLIIDYRYFDLVNVVFCFVAGITYGFPSGACSSVVSRVDASQ